MHSERKLNVSLSMKIKGESTSVNVLPWDPFATLTWPCCFILLFIAGVPSARRFYFFISSVRAFGTTQSLLFISFMKPSMTTLPSSSSKRKPCFLLEWYILMCPLYVDLSIIVEITMKSTNKIKLIIVLNHQE